MYELSFVPFSAEEFAAPHAAYRGAPFWSWNGKLEWEKLKEQIDVMHEMGFGGFHIHARIGLATEYLGEEFLDLVARCEAYAAEKGMFTYLYDEDKWPSGVGGGRVTCNPDFAIRYLLFSRDYHEDGFLDRHLPPSGRITKNGECRMLCRCEVCLDEAGYLAGSRLLADGEDAGENTWYLYEVVMEKTPWFDGQPYVDTMNAKATEKFLEVTHEKYYEKLGDKFGKSIPSIFTDEPSHFRSESLADSRTSRSVGLPYTAAMNEIFAARTGKDLFASVPEIVFDLPGGVYSPLRYAFHEMAAGLFADNYGGVIARWCEAHGLINTGHLLLEGELDSQAESVGDSMRALSRFMLPGIDILADRHEYMTAKQAQSIAHQYGRVGAMSELYGVTNWDFDFRGHKHQGDWQAALGITLRVPHLAWMSMAGESKRDYPAAIDQHSPWYKKYPLIEDHFARVNTAMTRGKAVERVALLHPVESYWMVIGPDDHNAAIKKRLSENYLTIIDWLLFSQYDFDFLCEAILPEIGGGCADGKLHVGQMAYDAVVVPESVTMRRSTLDMLKAFREAGGKVLFVGLQPSYVDGAPSDEVKAFAASCETVGFDKDEMLARLEDVREVGITEDATGLPAERLMYQLREDGGSEWLFIVNGKKDDRVETSHWQPMDAGVPVTICVKGEWSAEEYDTATGEVKPMAVCRQDGCTCIPYKFYPQDSLLVKLSAPEEEKPAPAPEKDHIIGWKYAPGVVSCELAEENVCVLDRARWRLDGGEWQPAEDMLKLDDAIRAACGYQLRTESFLQPWLKPLRDPEHEVELSFTFTSEIGGRLVSAAFEGPKGTELVFNGNAVPMAWDAYYVDRDIHKEIIGALKEGENTLYIRLPYGEAVNIENVYLLGDFGVRVTGDTAVITKKPETIGFGGIQTQGLAFYGGNLTYVFEAETCGSAVEIEVPEYKGALLTIAVDGCEKDVYAAPYRARFDAAPGKHEVRITLYGNRYNTFGQLHNCNRREVYFGPKSYRTTGSAWTYVYQLRDTGVMVQPIIRCLQA